jgi:uncharacterized membrane protein YfcA
MVALSMQTLSIVWAGAFLGALAAGGAGFAFALVASSIWLHGLEPLQTTALVVACGTLLHVTLVWPIRGSIEPARLFPFVIGAVVGIPLGVLALTYFNSSALKISLGVFLTMYGCYALLAPRLPQVTFGGRAADGAIGFIGGVLGGIGGYSGVIPTVWTQLRGWSKNTARGVYQPFILFAHVTTLLLVGAASFNRGGVTLFVCALPALAAGAWLGLHIYGRLDENRFKQVLSAMLIASGLSLVI